MTDAIKLRPEVQWFAERLELELCKGDEPNRPRERWWVWHGADGFLRGIRKSLVELDDATVRVRERPCSDALRLAVLVPAVEAASRLLMIATNWRPSDDALSTDVVHMNTDASCCKHYSTDDPTFICSECQRRVGWCMGRADDRPDICDDCYVTKGGAK